MGGHPSSRSSRPLFTPPASSSIPPSPSLCHSLPPSVTPSLPPPSVPPSLPPSLDPSLRPFLPSLPLSIPPSLPPSLSPSLTPSSVPPSLPPSPRVRKLKVGHGGTLDRLAEGVLVVGVGADCRHLTSYLAGGKSYEAVGELGRETDTGDGDGRVVTEKPYK